MNKRLIVAILMAAVLLVVSGFPAAAGEGTPVSGLCWFLDEPDSPDVRSWANGKDDAMYHMRNEKQLAICDFDDDRLDGYMLLTVKWDVLIDWLKYPNAGWIAGHDQGDTTMMDLEENVTWTGCYNNFIDETSTIYGTTILHGVGAYKDLKFKGTVYFSFTGSPDWAVHIEGEIK